MSRFAVVVTDQRLWPPFGGNRVRILGIVRMLRATGWRVAIVTSHECPHELLSRVDGVHYVRSKGYVGGEISRFDVRPFAAAMEIVIARFRPSLVIAEYAWMAPVLASVPRTATRWVDCHDILSQRTTRFIAAGLDPWVICSEAQERALLSLADVLVTTQFSDEAFLKALLPKKKVQCVLPAIDLPDSYAPGSGDHHTVLVVGANHAGNEGIRRFVTVHWREVRARVPQAKLWLAGTIASAIPETDGVTQFAASADLKSTYEKTDVVVCPIELGTGVKVKMAEALRLGKATVATPAAIEGLPTPNETAWVTAPDVRSCVDGVVDLLTNRELRQRMETAAFAYGEKTFSTRSALLQLQPILPGRFHQALTSLVC